MNGPTAGRDEARAKEARQLARLRDDLAALGRAEWLRTHDEHGCMLETRGERGEIVGVARFAGTATEDEIAFACSAPANVAFLLGLLDRAVAKLREIRAQAAAQAQASRDTSKDFAAEAAMRCAEPGFRAFLEDRHGLQRPLTDERVAQRLRSILGVASRAELNNDEAAAARWKQLRGAYEDWKRAGR